jgi:large subunit ribosomal protein L29
MGAKTPKAKELRGSSEADLRTQLEAARRELWDGRLKARAGSLQQPHRLRAIRRQAARLLTVLKESQSAGSSAPAPKAGS